MPLQAGARIKASDLDFPALQVRGTTAQSIPNNAWTAVAFNVEDIDDDNMHDNVTNNTRMTAKRAGRFQISGASGFAVNTTGARGAKFALNGVVLNASSTLLAPVATFSTVVPTRTLIVTMAIGDFLELQCFQNSTIALALTTVGENQSSVTVTYLGS